MRRPMIAAAALLLTALFPTSPAHAEPLPDLGDSAVIDVPEGDDPSFLGEWRAEIPQPTDVELLALADAENNAPPEDPEYIAPDPDPDPAPAPAAPAPAPAPSDCLLSSPFEPDTNQADDDCDGTSNVCDDIAPSAYTDALREGTAPIGSYCIQVGHTLIMPPFPRCSVNDLADYDCDGNPDVFRIP